MLSGGNHSIVSQQLIAQFCGASNINATVLAFKYRFNWRDNTDPQIYLNWEKEQLSMDGAKISLES